MQIRLTRNTLPLVAPVVTTQGVVNERTVWVVQIADGSGRVGMGEASPLPAFGTETPEACVEALRAALKLMDIAWIGSWLMRGRPDAPLGRSIEDTLAKTPCARAAVEGALIDLMAQQQDKAVATLLAVDAPAPRLAVNAFIAGDLRLSLENARTFASSGFGCFKFKLSGDIPMDLERIFAIRAAIGKEARLRVDANGAWDLERAMAFAVEAADAQLEYCEQPLAPGHLEDLAALRRRSGMAVAVDEDIRCAADLGRVASAQAADVAVLKPAFLGGWRPTKQAVELARTCGIDVVVTTVFDGAVGRAHATHQTAALQLAGRAHGLATGILLAEDLTDDPLIVQSGFMVLRTQPGLGIGKLRR